MAADQAASVSKEQILLFKTFEEAKDHGERLSLKRVLVQDISAHGNLHGCYVGGKVVNVVSESYSQGHDSLVFVEDGDAGIDALHLIIRISGELVEMLPSINREYQIFVSGALRVENEEIEFSQDTGKCVVVMGPRVQMWIVHPKAGNPRLYDKSFGPSWWKKRKKRVDDRKKKKFKATKSSLAALTKPNVEEGLQRTESSNKPGPSSGNLETPGSGSVNQEEPCPTSVNQKQPGCNDTVCEEHVPSSVSPNRSCNGDQQQQPGPSGISQEQPGPSGISREQPGPSGISRKQPGPSGVTRERPGPSGVTQEQPGPSGVTREQPSPSSITQEQPGPSGITQEQPGPSGVTQEQPGPSSVTQEQPDPSSVTQEQPDPSSISVGLEETSRNKFSDEADFLDSSFNSREEEEEKSDSTASSESDSSTSSDFPEVAWSPKSSSTTYNYTKLADLEAGLKRANVIAVVKEFGQPQMTRGAQFCFTLTVVDESDPLVGVKCIIFNSNVEKLPQVKREGDIVCLHRINTNEYRNVIQIEGPPFSASMRFSSKIGSKMAPTTGSLSYTFTTSERQRVRELRRWARQRKRNELTEKLESIREGVKTNLLCQVVWIAQPSSANETILSVWDGTVCPLANTAYILSSNDITSDPTLTSAVGPELQRQVKFEGKISRKVKVKPGSVVVINNIESTCTSESSEVELCVRGKISKNVEVISARESCHSELKDRLEVALSAQNSVTTTPHSAISLSTLQEIKDHPLEKEPTKFHCKAKLVGILTPSAEETVRLFCERCGLFSPISKSTRVDMESGLSTEPCLVCYEAGKLPTESSTPPPPRCMFFVRLLLADSSGSLEIHVPHNEAIQLFRGLKPANFYRDQTLRYQLMKMLYTLSGGNPPFCQQPGEKVRPWIDCCLVKVEYDEVYYCLFDTALKAD